MTSSTLQRTKTGGRFAFAAARTLLNTLALMTLLAALASPAALGQALPAWPTPAATPTPTPAAGGGPSRNVEPRRDYREVATLLTDMIRAEMLDKKLRALSIALIEGHEVVWAEGFGLADPERKIAASAETLYRAGSISKLFTDIAILRLVEDGTLDLDTDVSRYVPDFKPLGSYKNPITLRMLMTHVSGLVREPPVGHYFDPESASTVSLEKSVASLSGLPLAFEPGTQMRYSNAGIALSGYVLERTQGQPFADFLRRTVLVPLEMRRSAFRDDPSFAKDLATGEMWSWDGRSQDAPKLGTFPSPAGSMVTNVLDLSRFLSLLFFEGKGPGGPFLKPETVTMMLSPQFAPPGTARGVGLGFAVADTGSTKRFGHDASWYGVTTSLQGLLKERLGVALIVAKDSAGAVTGRVAEAALKLMAMKKENEKLTAPPTTSALERAEARRMAGRYKSGELFAEITEAGGEPYLSLPRFGPRLRLRRQGEALIVDDAASYGLKPTVEGDRLTLGSGANAQVFEKVPEALPEPVRRDWQGLLGVYGSTHNPLIVFESKGQLHALVDWIEDYPLSEVGKDEYRFPAWGIFAGETLTFVRDAKRHPRPGAKRSGPAVHATPVTAVLAGRLRFERRAIGPKGAAIFRIKPVRPVAELRREAFRAKPPEEAGEFLPVDLAELTTLDPTIRLDIRYATQNNFLGTPVYGQPRAFLQRPAAEALVRAHRKLKEQGLGLLVHDGYRPWYVTKVFWDATPQEGKDFVADPATGSRHNRGCAVDLTLFDLKTGRPVEMPGAYDEMSLRSYPYYAGGTSRQRHYRDLLRRAMEDEGFDVYAIEWWHFDYKDYRKYPIFNVPFEKLGLARAGRRTG